MDNNPSKYISVSELTRDIKENLESSYPYVFLKGEISNFRPASSGHWFFHLKDKNSSIKSIIFKYIQSAILDLLYSYNIESLKDGQEVLVKGKINLYERSGEYSIIINKLIPVGIGELSIKFEMLKEKLFKEGLFDDSIKKPLPKYPDHIGIITSPTAAALQDIKNVLGRRFSSTKVTVFPAGVQGENAKNDLVKAIDFANYQYKNNTDLKVDVLILTRGGGSIEDLWPFNEEIVAYAINRSEIPIITGIGHEIDFTIADFCADLRAPTPSAAAEIVVKNRDELLDNISNIKDRIIYSTENLLAQYRTIYDKFNKTNLTNIFTRTYERSQQDLIYFKDKLVNNFNKYFLDVRQRFNLSIQKLDNLSPLKVLSRGYSLVIDKNKNIIKKYSEVNLEQELNVILSQGSISVKVLDINKNNIIFKD